MPSIKDKLKAEERNERTIRLWPEGTFYKAYERSAYLFVTHLRPYEVRKRYIQAAGRDVVSIGFPQAVLSKLEVSHAPSTDGAEIIQLSSSFDEQQYLLWRNTIAGQKNSVASVAADFKSAAATSVVADLPLELRSLATKGTQESATINAVAADFKSAAATPKPLLVLQRLREFNLANATPMQCMLLISELQTLLN